MNALSFRILAAVLIKQAGADSPLARAFGKDLKGKGSMLIYAVALGLTFVNANISLALYALVAVLWFIPDPRIERVLLGHEDK